jgi:2-polyprenyl-6-methoxyphenol hydroxylase-like FAD-dependent oxidoreductase
MSQRSILVVGGGIAGLTVANALAEAGHVVEVVEIDPNWPTVGWGLTLTGPALRALEPLGLADECIAAGFGSTDVCNCIENSQQVATVTPPRLLGPERPAQAGIARPVLREILRTHAEKRGVTLRSGVTVSTMVDDPQDPTGVQIQFDDGSFGSFDLVVGADGIRSATRSMIGIEATPGYTGQMVWRARVPRPEWALATNTFAGKTNSCGLIPIGADSAYIFHTENTDDTQPVPHDELADRFRARLANFTGRIADVLAGVTNPDDVVRRPVHVLLADQPWHRGRTVLIGDAAHAPSPQMISGAALAIEDALVLTEVLGTAENGYADDDLQGILAGYAARRYNRCAAVIEASLKMAGIERSDNPMEAHKVQGMAFAAMAAPM